MNDGIPMVEEKEHHYLEQLAAQEDWEHGDYFVGRDLLNAKFHTWVPTFAAYSVIILLHSIVEAQLDALAEYLGRKHGSQLQFTDMAGRGMERSANYLKLVLSIDVKA